VKTYSEYWTATLVRGIVAVVAGTGVLFLPEMASTILLRPFGVVIAMTPVMWGLNRYFRRRLSRAYRNIQESFSRVTSTLAESVNGIRVTKGFVRENVNSQLFHDLVRDHVIGDATWARLSEHLDDRVITELIFVVGSYTCLAMVFNSAGIQLDDDLADFPPLPR